jgi:hypothetical protein
MPPIICLFCILMPAGPFDQFQLPRGPLACDYWPCTPIPFPFPFPTRQLWLLNSETGIVIEPNHPILIVKRRAGQWQIVTIPVPSRQ